MASPAARISNINVTCPSAGPPPVPGVASATITPPSNSYSLQDYPKLWMRKVDGTGTPTGEVEFIADMYLKPGETEVYEAPIDSVHLQNYDPGTGAKDGFFCRITVLWDVFFTSPESEDDQMDCP